MDKIKRVVSLYKAVANLPDEDLMVLLELSANNRLQKDRWSAFSQSTVKLALEESFEIKRSDFQGAMGLDFLVMRKTPDSGSPGASEVKALREFAKIKIADYSDLKPINQNDTQRGQGSDNTPEVWYDSFWYKAGIGVACIIYATWSILSDKNDLGGSSIHCYADGRCVDREVHEDLMESNSKKYQEIQREINKGS
ncbi:hypothetical protein N8739_00620 [Luminiphilus sp.]|nr:hypothetical protein [Luminiphilus sp.]